jgi:hypothetical protein
MTRNTAHAAADYAITGPVVEDCPDCGAVDGEPCLWSHDSCTDLYSGPES